MRPVESALHSERNAQILFSKWSSHKQTDLSLANIITSHKIVLMYYYAFKKNPLIKDEGEVE